jgi:hypothetical protein
MMTYVYATLFCYLELPYVKGNHIGFLAIKFFVFLSVL